MATNAANAAAAPAYPPTVPGVLVMPPVAYQSRMIRHLLNLPTNQAIQYRPLNQLQGQHLPIYDRAWKIQAALIQQKGVVQHGAAACVHCRLLAMGPYAECVYVPGSGWGCGNREFSSERTNSQLSERNNGCISSTMLTRNLNAANQVLMLAEANTVAPGTKQTFINWSTAHVLTLNNTTSPLELSREAIRRVILRTGAQNMLAQNAVPNPNVEITEGVPDPINNALTVARAMAMVPVPGTLAAVKDQKYRTAAETQTGGLVELFLQERADTMAITSGDPGYIFMTNSHQRLVCQEIRDMMDRRFTIAVATVMGVIYDGTQAGTALCLRLPNDQPNLGFNRPTGAATSWRPWNRNQRTRIQVFN